MSLIYTAPAATTGGRRNSIYIGGRSDAKSLEKLERWGISRILNVTPAKETSIQSGVPNFFEKTKRFVYKRIPVYDAATSAAQLEAQADGIVSFITSGLFHGSVLVHCQHGVSRSTTCVAMYLIRKADLSLADALALVQRRRPHVQPIPAFVQLLERYEAKVRRESSSSDRPAKKAKLAAGPSIGPVCGPQGPPLTTNSVDKVKRTMGPAIGPSTMPPLVGPSLPADSTAKEKDRNDVEPTVDHKGSSDEIGPPLPPPQSPPGHPTTKDANTVGPSLPPRSS